MVYTGLRENRFADSVNFASIICFILDRMFPSVSKSEADCGLASWSSCISIIDVYRISKVDE